MYYVSYICILFNVCNTLLGSVCTDLVGYPKSDFHFNPESAGKVTLKHAYIPQKNLVHLAKNPFFQSGNQLSATRFVSIVKNCVEATFFM